MVVSDSIDAEEHRHSFLQVTISLTGEFEIEFHVFPQEMMKRIREFVQKEYVGVKDPDSYRSFLGQLMMLLGIRPATRFIQQQIVAPL
ncbi:hypothetical protein D3C76_94710 [compost metagenome]